MKQELMMALEIIRLCRNNMSKQEFLDSIREVTNDNNIAFPLLEAASVCSMDRIRQNVEYVK
jgi:hypothetical protein